MKPHERKRRFVLTRLNNKFSGYLANPGQRDKDVRACVADEIDILDFCPVSDLDIEDTLPQGVTPDDLVDALLLVGGEPLSFLLDAVFAAGAECGAKVEQARVRRAHLALQRAKRRARRG